MTESEWRSCSNPFDMLRHLDGQIHEEEFIRFSVGCCRSVWHLLTDRRSRAVVEAAEAYIDGTLSQHAALAALREWNRANEADELYDNAGGNTHEAVESVCGIGFGHAAQVAAACADAAGFAASESLRSAGAPQSAITEVWEVARIQEWMKQCRLLRQLFDYHSGTAT